MIHISCFKIYEVELIVGFLKGLFRAAKKLLDVRELGNEEW